MYNGRYAEKRFRGAVEDANQGIIFCAVGAHHQNGTAEYHTKILTLGAITLLFHACWHWPEAITTMLWPLALLVVVELHNVLKIGVKGEITLGKFPGAQSIDGNYRVITLFSPW